MTDCPQDPIDDRFPGLDNLLTLMGHKGLKFFQSPDETLLSGPDGIIAADDVVVVKINYQWDERGGTNTDLLRGLIRCIVDHPDTFTGEIVIAENAQDYSGHDFDRQWNNAQDYSLSPHDVVVWFQGLDHTISHFDWGEVRFTQVYEYSQGDMRDGYIKYPGDPYLWGHVSYPKFQSEHGTYVSIRDGIWDADGETYDRERLKFINVPVLKSHSGTYSATVCVKNYMGVVTQELNTNSHDATSRGILGALLGEIRLADLGILLADWGCTGMGCPGDMDIDGDTDQADLGILLAHWGEGCP